ncbi:MAG: hypothetical protein ACLFQK_10495 [Fibrobacterota bacterium]
MPLLLFVFVPVSGAPADVIERLMKESERGELQKSKALSNAWYSLFMPQKLLPEYRALLKLSSVKKIPKYRTKTDITLLLKAIETGIEDFSDEFINDYRAWKSTRTADLDLTYDDPSGRFRINYTRTGTDSVSGSDTNSNSVPDYIDICALVMDSVYKKEITDLGFHAPNTGGGPLQIYIKALAEGYFGYTQPYSGGYVDITLDNNFRGLIRIIDTTYRKYDPAYMEPSGGYITIDYEKQTELGMQVTLAHEFFHAVQFYYDRNNEDFYNLSEIYFYESSAVLMEDIVYDHVNDYIDYVYDFTQTSPWNVFHDMPALSGSSDLIVYSKVLWFMYLYESEGGGIHTLKSFWEKVEDGASSSFDIYVSTFGDTAAFAERMAEFSGWCFLTGHRADTSVSFSEGNLYKGLDLISAKVYDGSSALLDLSLDGGFQIVTNGSVRNDLRFRDLGSGNSEYSRIMLADSSASGFSVSTSSPPMEFTGNTFTGRPEYIIVSDPLRARELQLQFVPDTILVLRDSAGFQLSDTSFIRSVDFDGASSSPADTVMAIFPADWGYGEDGFDVVFIMEPFSSFTYDSSNITVVFSGNDDYTYSASVAEDSSGLFFSSSEDTISYSAGSGLLRLKTEWLPKTYVGIRELLPLPYVMKNAECYPNPFILSKHSEIRFPYYGEAAYCAVYNSSGVLVRKIDDKLRFDPEKVYFNDTLSVYPGSYTEFSWDGKTASGKLAGEGVYFFRIKSGNLSESSGGTGKFLIIK